MFTLAHISDLHLSPMPRARLGQLLGKRAIGYLNWHRGRKRMHRRRTLDGLIADLERQRPDHIAVTGDLVNVSLPAEFDRASRWLHQLGAADRVTVVPGNHDAYVAVDRETGIGRWSAYMAPSAGEAASDASERPGFPFVRRLGRIALIGLSSAQPTPPFMAFGRLEAAQLHALPGILARLREQDLFRVVLVHHPPLPGLMSWRNALHDAPALREVLRAEGAELVLYGHKHEQAVDMLEWAGGACAVVGVPSASASLPECAPLARFNLFHIAEQGRGWTCEMVGRGYRRPDGPIEQIERVRLGLR